MGQHLDYCAPDVRPPAPWRQAFRICGWVFVGVIGFVVAVLGAMWGLGSIPPNLDRTLTQSALKPMPASFVLTQSSAENFPDQSVFYSGTMSPKDAADLVAQLAADKRACDQTAKPVTAFWGKVPTSWTSPTWNDRRTFNIWANDVWLIHISPSTGAVEIECERF